MQIALVYNFDTFSILEIIISIIAQSESASLKSLITLTIKHFLDAMQLQFRD